MATRRWTTLVVVGSVLGMFGLVAASPAQAAGSYPPAKPHSAVNRSCTDAGSAIQFSVYDFQANSGVAVTITGPDSAPTTKSLGSIATDGSGAGSMNVTVGNGTYTITGSGHDPSGQAASTSQRVCGHPAGSSGGTVAVLALNDEQSRGSNVFGVHFGTLPFTGASIEAAIIVALILITFGVALVVTSRRRRRATMV